MSGTVFTFGQLPGPRNDLLPGEDASIKLAHRYLDVRTESIFKRVERADVVGMAVSESDPLDPPARLRGSPDQGIGGPAERRINEREAIVLADEVGVDRPESGELKQVIIELGDPRGPNSGTRSPLGILRFFFLPA